MAELISVTPEVYPQILITQPSVQLSYERLLVKAREDGLSPNPPIILTPMPGEYGGRYRYHLYNGNTRFAVARKYKRTISGLIVTTLYEIPEYEQIHMGIETVLRSGLAVKLYVDDESHDEDPLDALLQELYRRELLGLVSD